MYWGNTLVVSSFGDDSKADREQLGSHYKTLKAALTNARDGDCIIWLGNQENTNPVAVTGKSVLVYCLNASFSGNAGGAIFSLSGGSSLRLQGYLTINTPNATLASVSGNSEFVWDGGELRSCRLGVHASENSSVLIQGLKSMNFPTVTNKVGIFRQLGASKLTIRQVDHVSVSSPTEYFTVMYDGSELELDAIGKMELALDKLVNNFSSSPIKISVENINNLVFSENKQEFNAFGAIAGKVDFCMENCAISSYLRLLNAEGRIIIRNSRITGLSEYEPIAYKQTLDGSELTNNTIDSSARALLYENEVGSLLVGGNYLRKSFVPHPNIKAYDNRLLGGEEIDLGETIQANFTIDFSLGRVFFITLTQDVTLSFENVFKGVNYTLVFLQDSEGNHNVNLPADCEFSDVAGHPSFNFPAFYVVKMQVRIEKISDKLHCSFAQFTA